MHLADPFKQTRDGEGIKRWSLIVPICWCHAHGAKYTYLDRIKLSGCKHSSLFNQVDDRNERFKLLNRIEFLPGCKFFDGVKLYLPDRLTSEQLEVPVRSSSGLDITVKFRFKRSFVFTDPDAIQVSDNVDETFFLRN